MGVEEISRDGETFERNILELVGKELGTVGSQPHHLEVNIPWPVGGLEKRVDGELLGDGGDGAVAGAEDGLGGEAQDF